VAIRCALVLRIGTGVGGDPVNAAAVEEPAAVDGATGLDSTSVLDGGSGLDGTVVPVSADILESTAGLAEAGLLEGTVTVPDNAGANADAAPDDDAELYTGDDAEKIATDGEPMLQVGRPTDVTETLAPSALLPEVVLASEAFTSPGRAASSPAVWDADEIVTQIYSGHYNQLVRLALLLVHDVQTAEEVVQDAFEAMHLAWRRLRDSEKALSYLRQTVVNRSRSVLRHRKVVDMHAPKPAPDEPSAEHAALALLERSAVAAALRMLPQRQREAIVLRYYADFSEADIASAMGISRGAVKSHTARAMAALKSILEQETS
jgi:RNA polymerase sigma-70 factor (sigma-E family)